MLTAGCKINGKRFAMYQFHGIWFMNWHKKLHLIQHLEFLNYYIQLFPPTEYYIYGAYNIHSSVDLLRRDRINRSFILLCSMFLVTGSGMVKKS
jgi:hypothetical protein